MDDHWNISKSIGNSAENAIRYLINSIPNWKCMEFGVETNKNDIKKMVLQFRNPIILKVRYMPDFIAFNEKTGETFFIEVKYNSKKDYEKYIFNFLERYNEYWQGTKLIIVKKNKPHFVYIDLEKINDGMKEIRQVNGELKDFWNFKEIEQDIKCLFVDLKENDIEEATKMILK